MNRGNQGSTFFLYSQALEHLVIPLIIVIFADISYENAYQNAFTFDDNLAIVGNGDVDARNQPFSELWKHDIWGKDLLALDSHRSYRPLLICLFRYLWGISKSPSLFRVVSIIAHATTSCLLYILCKRILTQSKSYDADESLSSTSCQIISFVAALLFTTHPIHVEAVTAVVNSAEPLSAIFIIASYLIFRFDQRNHQLKPEKATTLSDIFKRILYFCLWWNLALVATLLKETGVISAVIPLTLLLIKNIIRSFGSKRRESEESYRPHSLIWTVPTFLFIYFYFGCRSVLINTRREEIMSQPFVLFQHLMTFFVQGQHDSYLNKSQLLRKAENPFSFLTGATKVYSMMVRPTYLQTLLENACVNVS